MLIANAASVSPRLLGLLLSALARHRYKGLSLSRKAFRCLRSLADLVTAAGKAATISTKPVPGVLGTVQWLLMSVHIFWDNMFFCTHPIVVRRYHRASASLSSVLAH